MQLDTGLPPGRPTTSTLAEEATAENELLTASTATLLLVLLAVEGVTILSIRPLLPIHIVIGMLLIPTVALKLASTGCRFLRYYRGSLAYVAKGPPHILMRSLAPLLVISTLTVLGSGVALLVLGPGRQTFVLGLHKTSFIFWLGVTSVHVLVYVRRLPRLLLSGGRQAGARIGLLAGSLLEGAALAAAT